MNTKTAKIVALMLGVEEVAQTLGVSVKHVRRMADSGRMPRPIRLGRLLKWNRATIESWCAAGCPLIDRRA